MDYIYAVAPYGYSSELYHHGTKGQKWGERKYQYEDGTLTPEGYRHYGYGHGGGGVGRSEHTKQAKREGTRTGAKIGSAIGLASGLATGTAGFMLTKQIGMDTGTAALLGAGIGAANFTVAALGGAVRGRIVGTIKGKHETAKARRYIEKNYDKKLKDFLAQDDADYKRRKQNRG